MKTFYCIIATALLVFVPNVCHLQTVANNKISIGGWVDAQYRLGINDDETEGAFSVRRARLDLKGDLSKLVSFRFQADLASSPRLVDAFVKLNFNKSAVLQIGQFKIPFSLENILSPLDVELTDNAQVISALSGYKDVTGISSYSNGRDIGIMLSGSFFSTELGGTKVPIVKYDIGVFGGGGINVAPTRLGKDVSGRLQVCPFVKDLTLSASAYLGKYEMDLGVSTDSLGVRRRFAAGAKYENKNLTLRGEYLYGQTDAATYDETMDLYGVYDFNTRGCYLTAGYWFYMKGNDRESFVAKIRPLVRWDYYVKDESKGQSSTCYWAGIECWPQKSLRLQLAYRLSQNSATNAIEHTVTAMTTVKF